MDRGEDRTGWEDSTVIGGTLIKLILLGLLVAGFGSVLLGWGMMTMRESDFADQGKYVLLLGIFFLVISLAGFYFGRNYLRGQDS
ncbi:MAG: hypothetical protein WCD81_08985 [Candidatus Bathyarchaeia archaeon]